MAPGFPYPVWPNKATKGKEPAHFFIAGDGDHSVSVANPIGDSAQFQYERKLIKNEKGTVGALAFSDLDSNDWHEMWVPNYDKSYIEVFIMSAATTETA